LQQIYVEIERARLIKRLAKIKEEQGLVAEAAELMQEVPVCELFQIVPCWNFSGEFKKISLELTIAFLFLG
jgi:hypothetical protein